MADEQLSISTILRATEVCPFSEVEIAAAVVFLKAYAIRHGKDAVPSEVWLSPFAPQEGWRRAAIRFCHSNAEKREKGEPINLAKRPDILPEVKHGLIETAR